MLKTFTQTMTAFLFRRLLSKTLSNNWDKTLLAISVGKLVTLSMSHFRVFFFHRVRQFLLSYPIQGFCVTCNSKNKERSFGWEPWSSGYGRRLMFHKSWVWIPALYTGWSWHFFTLICCKNCTVCLKRPKINKKEAELAHSKTFAFSARGFWNWRMRLILASSGYQLQRPSGTKAT